MTSRLSPSAQKEFQRAVALLRQGRLNRAESICAELLARSPNDAELAHFGGILANRMGRYDLAIERLSRCLRLDPARARSHAALAFAQEKSGRFEEARQSFAAAVRADPGFAEAHNGLGIACHRLGRLDEALQSFERAVAMNPGFIEARLNAARALQQMGRSDAAAQRYREALELAGDNEQVLRQAAFGLQGAGAFEAAAGAMARILERHPDDAALRGELAHALDELGRTAEAQSALADAIAASPGLADLHNIKGALLQKRGEWAGAAAAFERAVELQADYCDARINLAVALRQLGRDEEAAKELALAGSGAGNDAAALARLATLHGEAGDARLAIELFESAVRLNPFLPGPRGLLGAELLRAGQFERGWKEYVFRPTRGSEIFAHVAQSRYPPALPADLRGRNVMLLGEQGLGDILFFLRYARPLAEAGARLHVHADRRLEPLVRRALPIASWLEGDEVPGDALAVWVGDLPAMVRPLAGDICPTLRIAPLADRVERMRARLPAAGLPRVGIAWQAGTPRGAGPAGHNLLAKEIPVEALARSLARRPATYVSIQRNPSAQSRQRFSGLLELSDFSDVNDDLEDMVALLSLLDDYVGVSSTNVHLLAAVGGGGRILVPHPAEWRWQFEGAQSPWFPGFTIYRQDRGGDWSGALENLRGGTS